MDITYKLVEVKQPSFKFLPDLVFSKNNELSFEEKRGLIEVTTEKNSISVLEKGERFVLKSLTFEERNSISKVSLAPEKTTGYVYGYTMTKPNFKGKLTDTSYVHMRGEEIILPSCKEICIGLVEPRDFFFEDINHETILILYLRNNHLYVRSSDNIQEEKLLIEVPEGTRLLKCGLTDYFLVEVAIDLPSKKEIKDNSFKLKD